MKKLNGSWRMYVSLAAIAVMLGVSSLVLNLSIESFPFFRAKQLSALAQVKSYPYSNEDHLFEAINDNDLATAKMLIDNGVDVNFLPDYCESDRPLIAAIYEGNIAMIELLLDAGASNTATALDPGILYSVSRTKDEDILSLLLDRIADVNKGDKATLKWAIERDWPYMIETLLKKRADPNMQFRHPGGSISENVSGNAFVFAMYKQDIKLMELLLEYGADVNPVSKDGFTPLTSAFRDNISAEIILMLIDAGANVNIPEPTGDVRDGHLHYSQYSVPLGGKSPLHYAADMDDEAVYRAIINAGADLECCDWKQATPLVYAALNRDSTGVKLLLAAGANPNHVTLGGQSPLHVAAQSGNLETTKLLVKNGARVNGHSKSKSGHGLDSTPLGEACEGCRNVDVIKYLIVHGADPTIEDGEGKTPLQYLLDNPVTKGHDWDGHLDTCSLEKLTANREQIIEILQQYE